MTIRSIAVRNLGRIGYARGLEIQKTLQRAQLQRIKQAGDASRNPSMTQAQYQCNDVLDTLLICQHDPVYTIGIRRDGFDEEIEKLKKLNLNCDYYKTSRGGLITFHGPGQLVCYPIINLAHFTKSIRWYIHQLEECLIATCKRFNVAARTTQHTGVWVDDSKIAAIGIRSSRWVTLHGIALNCNIDLSWFDHIVPCGIQGKGVTSLTAACHREITVDDVIQPFIESFCDVFNCRVIHDISEHKKQKL